MGRGDRDPQVLYLIDFGLAKLYIDPDTGEHISYQGGLPNLGTARYCSYNVHFGRGEF